jgi:uncharacterized protein (TIGR00369 family)
LSAEEWNDVAARVSARAANWGVSSQEDLRRRSGLEFLRAIARGELPSPPIGRTLNFFLLDVEEGRAVFQGTPTFDSMNPIGSIHGGWASTLLDSCMACAIQTTLRAGYAYTTVELKVNLVRALLPETGPVRAEGKVIHAGRQIATSDGKLYGADGRLYAHGTTTCVIFPLAENPSTSAKV